MKSKNSIALCERRILFTLTVIVVDFIIAIFFFMKGFVCGGFERGEQMVQLQSGTAEE